MQNDLFLVPAESELVSAFRMVLRFILDFSRLTANGFKCLDTGDEFPASTASSEKIAIAIGETLLELLDSLTEPAVAPGASGQQGLGEVPHTIATSTHGLGDETMNGTLEINAPISTEAGTFLGTITFTVS